MGSTELEHVALAVLGTYLSVKIETSRGIQAMAITTISHKLPVVSNVN
jgi:hypothetical protein